MQDDTDADFFQIPRPRGIVRALLYLLHLRAERLKQQDRSDTITSVAAVLIGASRDGVVVSRQHHDEWSITLGPAVAASTVPALRSRIE